MFLHNGDHDLVLGEVVLTEPTTFCGLPRTPG
jgi:hypothetical protein